MNPIETFRAQHYLTINQARMAHLKSLGLFIRGKTILELGAGIGDITKALVDMSMGSAKVTRVESRPENCEVMEREMPEHPVICDDLMCPKTIEGDGFDLAVAYGILYHLSNPENAVKFMARHCEMAVVETCVSMGDAMKLNQVMEGEHDPSQSSRGVGSRPTRPYMLSVLEGHFRYVYCPTTQPDHYQFPLDWEKASLAPLTRAIFVCSRRAIHNPLLVKGLPVIQTLHEQA